MAYGYLVQGDNGITVNFTVDRTEATTLEGATVTVYIKRGGEILEKQATILDVTKKECSFDLTKFDLTVSGKYAYQYTVVYADGRIYTGKMESLSISNKLTGNTTITLDGGTF